MDSTDNCYPIVGGSQYCSTGEDVSLSIKEEGVEAENGIIYWKGLSASDLPANAVVSGDGNQLILSTAGTATWENAVSIDASDIAWKKTMGELYLSIGMWLTVVCLFVISLYTLYEACKFSSSIINSDRYRPVVYDWLSAPRNEGGGFVILFILIAVGMSVIFGLVWPLVIVVGAWASVVYFLKSRKDMQRKIDMLSAKLGEQEPDSSDPWAVGE